jgi:hypothetical protein
MILTYANRSLEVLTSVMGDEHLVGEESGQISRQAAAVGRAPLPTPSTNANPIKTRETLWQFPESLPFTSIDPDNPSEGIFSYDPVPESVGVLRVDSYLSAIFNMLEKEENWAILSYILLSSSRPTRFQTPVLQLQVS